MAGSANPNHGATVKSSEEAEHGGSESKSQDAMSRVFNAGPARSVHGRGHPLVLPVKKIIADNCYASG